MGDPSPPAGWSSDEDIAIWEVLGIAEDAYLRSLREAPVS